MEFADIELRKVELRMKNPFETSSFRIEDREIFVLAAKYNDKWIYGETSVLPDPAYNHEANFTAQNFIKNYVIPTRKEVNSIKGYWSRMSKLKGHPHAKSSGDQLLYYAKSLRQEKSLKNIIGGNQSTTSCGISIGVSDEEEIVDKVQNRIDQGYKRIKVKIKPGKDIEYIKKVRKHFPEIKLMADANSAYSLEHKDRLKKLDQFNLQMIEQPLSHDDIVNHSVLNSYIETPICLDESIKSAEDVRRASRVDACDIINLKPQRVGGIRESVKINEVCEEEGIDMWIGSVLESGIGASTLIHVSSLSQVNLPGDIAPSKRYFEGDIVEPEIEINQGNVEIPDKPGLTNKVDRNRLKEKTVKKWCF
jgi:O-succinylbenzoate synthase